MPHKRPQVFSDSPVFSSTVTADAAARRSCRLLQQRSNFTAAAQSTKSARPRKAGPAKSRSTPPNRRHSRANGRSPQSFRGLTGCPFNQIFSHFSPLGNGTKSFATLFIRFLPSRHPCNNSARSMIEPSLVAANGSKSD